MSEWTIVRRAVAIAGTVTDALSGRPIAGALIAITSGPPAFLAQRAILARDPAWERQAERLDRRRSRRDGLYAFSDLPPGAYELVISAPDEGSRYGTATLPAVAVTSEREPSGRIKLAPADAALAPTRITGRVLRGDTNPQQPALDARARLRGDTNVARADADGRFTLSGISAGSPTLEVTAPGYRTLTLAVTLAAGQEQSLNNLVLTAGP